MREGRDGCEGGGEGWCEGEEMGVKGNGGGGVGWCEGEEMGVGGETEGVKQGWEFALSLFGN